MKIELIGTEQELAGYHTLHVAATKDENGKPVTSSVEFVNGVAECADNIAAYLIDTKQAKATGKAKTDAKAAE